VKISKNIISQAEASRLAPDYVQWLENPKAAEAWSDFDKMIAAFAKLKRGQKVVTFVNGVYVIAKVSSVRSHFDNDGPVIRVSNGEWT
jgi:hypothetical protein